jgi:hypothetical protein
MLPRMARVRLASLDGVGVARHEDGSRGGRVDVVRVSVDALAVDFAGRSQRDAPAFTSALAETIPTVVAVTREDTTPFE